MADHPKVIICHSQEKTREFLKSALGRTRALLSTDSFEQCLEFLENTRGASALIVDKRLLPKDSAGQLQTLQSILPGKPIILLGSYSDNASGPLASSLTNVVRLMPPLKEDILLKSIG